MRQCSCCPKWEGGGAGFIYMNSSQPGLASFTYYPTPELWFCSGLASVFFIFSDIWEIWGECEVWKKLLIPGSWPEDDTKSIFKIQYLIQTPYPARCETTVLLCRASWAAARPPSEVCKLNSRARGKGDGAAEWRECYFHRQDMLGLQKWWFSSYDLCLCLDSKKY